MPPSPSTNSSRFSQLVSDSSLYTLGNVLRRSLSLITLPVFTRYLSTSGYGVLSIVGTVQNMLEVFYEMGIASSSTRFYYNCQNEEEKKELFGTLLIFSLIVSSILTLVLLALGSWGWEWIGKDISFYPYMALSIGSLFLANLGLLPRVLFRVKNQVPRYFRYSICHTTLVAGLSVVSVVWFGAGPLGPLVSAFIVAALFGGVYAYYLRNHVRLVFHWSIVKRALAFGLPDIPMRWGIWALKVADRLILQHFTSLSVVAVYTVGYSVSKMPFDLVSNSIHWAIVPFFYDTAANESETRSKEIFARIATYNVAALAVMGLVTVLFGRELIEILASAKYAPAEAIIPIIVAASFLQGLFYIPSKGIYLKGKTLYLPLLFLIPAGLNITLNFILIPQMGMLGAAWATLAAYSVMIVLTFVVSQRIYPIPYEYGRILKLVLAACVLATCKGILPEASVLVRIVAKAGVFVTFPLVLYLAGFFNSTEVDWIRSRGVALMKARLQRAA